MFSLRSQAPRSETSSLQGFGSPELSAEAVLTATLNESSMDLDREARHFL